MTECAPLQTVYGERTESDDLLPMEELGMESGYLLYETRVTLPEDAVFELENVRDYAAVYLDGIFQGAATQERRSIPLTAASGEHVLQCYVENIGRITYGPEILDNSKGLFGSARIGGETVTGWTITLLCVRACDVASLAFRPLGRQVVPCFRRGSFRIGEPRDCYLDVSEWGMGEVWINGRYLGSFWDEEKQGSILVPAEMLLRGENRAVVFDLKNTDPAAAMRLSDKPVFR